MHKTQLINTYTVSKSHSFVPASYFRSFGALSCLQILRLGNVCSTFRLRYAIYEPEKRRKMLLSYTVRRRMVLPVHFKAQNAVFVHSDVNYCFYYTLRRRMLYLVAL